MAPAASDPRTAAYRRGAGGAGALRERAGAAPARRAISAALQKREHELLTDLPTYHRAVGRGEPPERALFQVLKDLMESFREIWDECVVRAGDTAAGDSSGAIWTVTELLQHHYLTYAAISRRVGYSERKVQQIADAMRDDLARALVAHERRLLGAAEAT